MKNLLLGKYILVKNFNLVFEAMIDELIGDKDMENMKEQDDGKIIDHIYRYKDLFANSEGKQIYYVGDSKYYKIGHEVKGESLYKQFTYARNITQWHLDLFRSDAEKDREERNRYGDIKLRDELTEGYNIIPNFFISAMMNKKEGKEEMSFSFSDDKLTHVEWNRKEHIYKDCVFTLALDKCCKYKEENDKLLLELSQFFNFITDRNVDSILSFCN